MAGPQQTRHIGNACRIYRNSDNKVIAIDDISITADIVQLSNNTNILNSPYPGNNTASQRWHASAVMHSHRCLLHLGTGDRVVAKIQMLGNYKSIETISGDYLEAIWAGCDSDDDLPVSLNNLAKVGDSI